MKYAEVNLVDTSGSCISHNETSKNEMRLGIYDVQK